MIRILYKVIRLKKLPTLTTQFLTDYFFSITAGVLAGVKMAISGWLGTRITSVELPAMPCTLWFKGVYNRCQ